MYPCCGVVSIRDHDSRAWRKRSGEGSGKKLYTLNGGGPIPSPAFPFLLVNLGRDSLFPRWPTGSAIFHDRYDYSLCRHSSTETNRLRSIRLSPRCPPPFLPSPPSSARCREGFLYNSIVCPSLRKRRDPRALENARHTRDRISLSSLLSSPLLWHGMALALTRERIRGKSCNERSPPPPPPLRRSSSRLSRPRNG